MKDGDHIVEYPGSYLSALQLIPRRAVDWSKVQWINETADGRATLVFDPEASLLHQNWVVVDATFDKAVSDWKRHKHDASRGGRRWWRCW